MTIDLRSDDITLPTQAMREAMYRVEVSGEMYGETPTVKRLQELAAEITGKEAALFVFNGSMGNIIALLAHIGRGEAFLVGDQSYICQTKQTGTSTLWGAKRVVIKTSPDGMLDPDEVQASISDESDEHVVPTKLLCLENTHNYCGGAVLGIEQVKTLCELAHAHDMAVYMDGARIFHAATVLNLPIKTLLADIDSAMFSLSKGLCAPAGSILVGTRDFIACAQRIRKLLGGEMAQAGVFAAAGLIALEQMVERLAEDHMTSKLLAQGLTDFPQIEIVPERVLTNIVIFSLRTTAGQPFDRRQTDLFLCKSRERGVLLEAISEEKIRAVTHYGINAEDIQTALGGVRRVLIEMGV